MQKNMVINLNKKAVVWAGCACGPIAPIVAAVTKNPAYGVFACAAAAVVSGLVVGIRSIRNS